MFILIAQDCASCGNNTVVRCFKEQPSDEDIKVLNIYLNEKICVSYHVVEYFENDEIRHMKLL
jgi:hypothetical protein